MSKLSIQKISRADIPQLFAMISELADFEKLTIDMTEKSLEAGLFDGAFKPFALIAYLEREAVGYAIFFPNFSTFLAKPGLYLEDIYVKQKFRRQGFGKQIFAEVVRFAKENQYPRLDWCVLDWNTGAQKMYEAMGAKHLKDWFVYRIVEADYERAIS